MQVKEYIFHCKTNNKVKRIPHSYWQRVLNGQLPYPGFENQQIRIAQVSVLMQQNAPQTIGRIQCYQHRLNAYGFIEDSQQLPTDSNTVANMLYSVFRQEDITEEVLVELVEQLTIDTPEHHIDWQPSSDQLEKMVQQIWYKAA